MWTLILGILGLGGGIAGAVVFAAQWIPLLSPIASAISAIAGVVWRAIISVFVWVWNQAVAAPAWTAVLIGVTVLTAFWSGQRGYDLGSADTKASDAIVWAGKVEAAKTAAREDGYLRGSITRQADLDYAFLQGKNEGSAAALQGLLNQKGTPYVPQIITVDCVPYGFVRLLDAAGLGIADPHALPGSAEERDDACSGLSLHDAEALLVQALSERHDFEDRLLNIQGWVAQQRARNGGSDGPK